MRLSLVAPVLIIVTITSLHPVTPSYGAQANTVGAGKESADESAALQALDKKWADSFVKGDVDGVSSYYADDAVVMDPGPELMIRGKEAIKKSFAGFLGSIESASFKFVESNYRTVGNLGYGYGIFQMSYKDKKTGKAVTMKGRASTVFEKRDGKWLAVLDHASFPMPAEGGQ